MKTNSTNKLIYVFADWLGLDGPTLMGTLQVYFIRGSESYSFTYEPNWLEKFKNSNPIDPELSFVPGAQYSAKHKSNFGIFLDSAPDRWGRTLMKRKDKTNLNCARFFAWRCTPQVECSR